MKPGEPDFLVLEYVTITKDPRTGLVVAVGGTERAADILQRTGGFLTAPGPRGDYHRLPHGLPVEQQRLKATAASHVLLCAGHSVHLDPALNALTAPNGERDAALRYLSQLAERASDAESSTEVAEVLTEIAGPASGLLPLNRDVGSGPGSPCPMPRTPRAQAPTPSPNSGTPLTRCRGPPTGSSSPAIAPRGLPSGRQPQQRRRARRGSRPPPHPDAAELENRPWAIVPMITAPASKSTSKR